MFSKNFLKTYLSRAIIATAIYSITVIIFLLKHDFQSIWILYLGNALYMVAIALIIFFSNKAQKFNESAVSSVVSGHLLSFTGAALSVIFSLILYFLFSTGVFSGNSGLETLQRVPAQMRQDPHHDILFILIVNAALGNTITGFFAAIFTSFSSSNKKSSNEKSS